MKYSTQTNTKFALLVLCLPCTNKYKFVLCMINRRPACEIHSGFNLVSFGRASALAKTTSIVTSLELKLFLDRFAKRLLLTVKKDERSKIPFFFLVSLLFLFIYFSLPTISHRLHLPTFPRPSPTSHPYPRHPCLSSQLRCRTSAPPLLALRDASPGPTPPPRGRLDTGGRVRPPSGLAPHHLLRLPHGSDIAPCPRARKMAGASIAKYNTGPHAPDKELVGAQFFGSNQRVWHVRAQITSLFGRSWCLPTRLALGEQKQLRYQTTPLFVSIYYVRLSFV